jgi:hypothetical protein
MAWGTASLLAPTALLAVTFNVGIDSKLADLAAAATSAR